MGCVWKILGVLLLIVLPLAWGLGVEWVFRRIRGSRSGPGGAADNGRGEFPDDWVI